MEKLKINVIIAGRSYAMTVNNSLEEEAMRNAADSIKRLISTFEQRYAVNDKQDVLAMCALQFASKNEITLLKKDSTDTEVIDKLKELTNLVNTHLE